MHVTTSPALLAYIPALHRGYYQLFTSNPGVKNLYLLSEQIAQEFTPVHKELRALEHNLIVRAVESWQLFDQITVADKAVLHELNSQKTRLIIPDEIVTHGVVEKYLPDCAVEVSSIFLRWDKKSATASHTPTPDHVISRTEVDARLLQLAQAEGAKSSDWWRQVGALAVRDGVVIAQAHNTHLPSEQQPYAEGDPRAHFHKGDHIELTTAIHAEAKLVAEAAARGLFLADCDLYVTDFPCPPCAKLVAHAGIKRLFYQKGYAMLDGERVLKTVGVEVIQVKT